MQVERFILLEAKKNSKIPKYETTKNNNLGRNFSGILVRLR
jgi:hypothetical protein